MAVSIVGMNYSIPDTVATKGPFAPMRFEATVEECIVTHGEIPKDLAGGIYRTGPCWKRPMAQGGTPLLAMDGMVQGLVFENGRADFRNRFIRTPKYLLEEKYGRSMFEYADGGFGDYRDYGYGTVKRTPENAHTPQGTNFINIFPFNGDLVATGELGGPPNVIDPITLETKGIVDWAPALSEGIHEKVCYGDGAFCGHPKWDEDTGIVYGWNYSDRQPYVTMKFIHPDGTVESRELNDAPYNTVAHDIWLTPEWVVMPFQPFIIDRDRTAKGLPVFGWEPDLPIVLALIPRHNLQGEVRWERIAAVAHRAARSMRGLRHEAVAQIPPSQANVCAQLAQQRLRPGDPQSGGVPTPEPAAEGRPPDAGLRRSLPDRDNQT